MQETKNTSLFTEITAEESASVNGACYYSRYCHRHHHHPRRHIVYRRNCDGTFRVVYR
jgi:hypothetical protein